MAKITGPLLSFGSDGSIAKTVVYSSWKGISYARRYVVPANPRTTRQTVTRNLFSKLQRMWLLAPNALRAPYLANAEGRPYLGVNKFTGFNVSGVDTETPPTDMTFFSASPGAKGGLPPTSLVLVGGANQITATLTAPQVPTGWVIQSAQAVAFLDQDPATPFTGTIFSAEDLVTPYACVITGLASASDYVVSAYFVWTRPDGTLAYSTSLTDIESTT